MKKHLIIIFMLILFTLTCFSCSDLFQKKEDRTDIAGKDSVNDNTSAETTAAETEKTGPRDTASVTTETKSGTTKEEWNLGNGFLIDGKNSPATITETETSVKVSQGGSYTDGKDWGGVVSTDKYKLDGLIINVRFDNVPEAGDEDWICIGFLKNPLLLQTGNILENPGYICYIRYGSGIWEHYEYVDDFPEPKKQTNDSFKIESGDMVVFEVKLVDGGYFVYLNGFESKQPFTELPALFSDEEGYIVLSASQKDSAVDAFTYTIISVTSVSSSSIPTPAISADSDNNVNNPNKNNEEKTILLLDSIYNKLREINLADDSVDIERNIQWVLLLLIFIWNLLLLIFIVIIAKRIQNINKSINSKIKNPKITIFQLLVKILEKAKEASDTGYDILNILNTSNTSKSSNISKLSEKSQEQIYEQPGSQREQEKYTPITPPLPDEPHERINKYLRGDVDELYDYMFFADIKPNLMLNTNCFITKSDNGKFIAYKVANDVYYLYPDSRKNPNATALLNHINPLFDNTSSSITGRLQVKTPCIFKPGDSSKYIATQKGFIYFI